MTMEVREPSAKYLAIKSFKQTEIGTLPNDWEVEPLGKRATFRTGPFGSALHKSDYINDGIPIINPMHIVDGLISPSTDMTISKDAAKRLIDFCVKPGEVVIGRRGDMGRCAVVKTEQSGWLCGTGSMIIRPGKINAYFLQRVISSPKAIRAIEDAAVGTTMVNLNQGTLSNLKIQLPPRQEQDAIATALSDVDALIAGLERLIAKKRDIKQATMQQLLTGQTRLPGFSGEWDRSELKRIVSTPITDGPHLTPKFYDSGVPFLSVNNLVNNRIDLTDLRYISKEDDLMFARKCKPKVGDVLLGKAASVGKVAFVEEDFDFNIWSPIALIRAGDAVSAKFLYYQLLSVDCASQIALLTNSSSQGNIGMGDIEKLQISYPDSAEQTAIATVLSDIDADIEALEARLAKTRAIKQGMMQELLTGRIRLV